MLTIGLWFRASPLEGAINPELSGPGCVSSPLNELILNATEKKGKSAQEREREKERVCDYLIHPPSQLSIRMLLKMGGVKSTNTETVTKPRAMHTNSNGPHAFDLKHAQKCIISHFTRRLFPHRPLIFPSAFFYSISAKK